MLHTYKRARIRMQKKTKGKNKVHHPIAILYLASSATLFDKLPSDDSVDASPFLSTAFVVGGEGRVGAVAETPAVTIPRAR